MNSLAEVVIAFIELLEAEVQQLRKSIFNLGLSLALLVICVGMALTGAVLLAFALFFFLAPHLGPSLAALCIALLFIAGAGVLLWIARNLVQK